MMMVGGIVDNQEHLIIPIIIIIIILMMVIFMMIIILWVSPLSPFFGFSITKTGHFSGRASGLSRSPGNSGRGRRNGFPQWQWEKSHFWDGKLIPQWNHWYFFWQGDLTCPPSYRTFLWCDWQFQGGSDSKSPPIFRFGSCRGSSDRRGPRERLDLNICSLWMTMGSCGW